MFFFSVIFGLLLFITSIMLCISLFDSGCPQILDLTKRCYKVTYVTLQEDPIFHTAFFYCHSKRECMKLFKESPIYSAGYVHAIIDIQLIFKRKVLTNY